MNDDDLHNLAGVSAEESDVDDIRGLQDTLDSLMGVFEALNDRVDALEAAAAARDELDPADFAGWVEWLRTQYALGPKIPANWARLPGVRHELEALWAAWEASYTPERVPRKAFDAIQWHTTTPADTTRPIHMLRE